MRKRRCIFKNNAISNLLAQDLLHPSLRAKKYDTSQNIWQGRINVAWRFYFKIEGDSYYLLDIIPHPNRIWIGFIAYVTVKLYP
jgi:hypothetical protein